jgi:hypothetical protein
MDLQEQVRAALEAELSRQAEASEGRVRYAAGQEGRARIEGEVDLDAVAMAVVGSVAGGP